MTRRRGLLQLLPAWLASSGARAGAPRLVSASTRATEGQFRTEEFATVGVFGLDWLLDPRFTRLLDNIAASPGAVRGVRAFGALSLGRDKTFPKVTGGVWDDAAAPMDFSRSLAALETLVSRGLTPFLPLSFFPPAVSPVPIQPPPDWTRWQALVRGFLDACVQRFSADEVSRWWFEVWNEPNMPPFWGGSFEQYLDLYRATSAAVRGSGHAIRLGGPVLAYLPVEGPALMERFLAMLAAEPGLQCDFLSLHRKGVWSNEEREPDLARLVEAAEATAQAVLRLVPARAPGLAIVNDEADMRVGFDNPFPPRMTEQFPAWLAAVAIAHDALSARYAAHGMRFLAASDNANQQLAQGSFDGRRTLMTPISNPEDLVKLPVYGFYELLRLMQGGRGETQGALPPCVSHLITAGEHGVAALLTNYSGKAAAPFEYEVRDIAWPVVNVVSFCIDQTHTNPRRGWPDPASMRQAQELGSQDGLRSGVSLQQGSLRQVLALGPFATMLLWITPYQPVEPAGPTWIEARREGGNVLLRWTPTGDPSLFSYELTRAGASIAPVPLRAALWVDTDPPPGALRYTVAALSASGLRSPAASVTVG